jgi:hypothetical protein
MLNFLFPFYLLIIYLLFLYYYGVVITAFEPFIPNVILPPPEGVSNAPEISLQKYSLPVSVPLSPNEFASPIQFVNCPDAVPPVKGLPANEFIPELQ